MRRFNSFLLISLLLWGMQLDQDQVTTATPEKTIEEGEFLVRYRIEGLQSPYDLIRVADTIWISEYNNSKLWWFNIANETSNSMDLREDLTPLALREGNDGSIWFIDFDFRPQNESDYLVRLNTTTFEIETYAFPHLAQPLHLEVFGDIMVISMLNLDLLWLMNTTSREITSFDFPCNDDDCGPAGIAYDSMGNLWISDTIGNRLVKYNGNFTFFDLPPFFISPTFIFIKDDILWTGTHGGNKMLSFDTKTNEIKVYTSPQTPPKQYPTKGISDVEVSEKGDVWFAEHFINRFGRINGDTLYEYYIPQVSPLVQNLLTDGSKTWFVEENGYLSYLEVESLPTISISKVPSFELNAGQPTSFEFEIQYEHGPWTNLQFDVFAEVRRRNQISFFGNTGESNLDLGEKETYKINLLLTDELNLDNYTVVYGLNTSTFSATNSVVFFTGHTTILTIAKLSPYFLLILAIYVNRDVIRRFVNKQRNS